MLLVVLVFVMSVISFLTSPVFFPVRRAVPAVKDGVKVYRYITFVGVKCSL